MERKRLGAALFGLYCAVMLWLLFDRSGASEDVPYWEQVSANLNLVPFRTLRLFGSLLTDHRPHLVRAAVVNLFGNVVMFIPLGLLLPMVWEKLRSLGKVLLTTAAIITIVEIMQLFTLVGSCDIDDLILNLIGSALGYGVYRYLSI